MARGQAGDRSVWTVRKDSRSLMAERAPCQVPRSRLIAATSTPQAVVSVCAAAACAVTRAVSGCWSTTSRRSEAGTHTRSSPEEAKASTSSGAAARAKVV